MDGDADAYVKNQKVYVLIADLVPKVLNVIYANNTSKEELQQVMNYYCDLLMKEINNGVGKNGYPLPSIKGLDYSNSVSAIKKGYMEVCSTPVINVTMPFEEELLQAS